MKAEMAERLVRDEDELKRQLKEGREGSGEASPWTRVWPIRPKHDGTGPEPALEPEQARALSTREDAPRRTCEQLR